ncbi:MAG: BLUF domain-containing protein [Janthinobacterium lividum]
MNEDIYQIVYCSRYRIVGSSAEMANEVSHILLSAQTNNAKVGVTGGLLFNTVFFAQVLEGRMDAVEQIFERIQRDQRHSDLTILQSGYVGIRNFPEWSMAFAGTMTEQSHPFVTATLSTAAESPSEAGQEVLSLLRTLVIQEEHWALPAAR